jgi:ectoine hydroxylase-related dioxygenase (phytanoyl-CoA dioxygenase family)
MRNLAFRAHLRLRQKPSQRRGGSLREGFYIFSIHYLSIARHCFMECVLGPKCFAVRGIFFNKTRSSNWKVVWHQDLTIAVRERKDCDGFTAWTMKAGVLPVQPPEEVMNDILAIRLHLDESGFDNGPLRVIPGTHKKGRLPTERIGRWDKHNSITYTVPRGGALIMRPLLLHASSACAIPKSRRVIHLEFAATTLPHDLDWHDNVSVQESAPTSKSFLTS